jgi:hypothetical protein
MATSKTKRKCLLACGRKGFTLGAVNCRLQKESLGEISGEEWVLWVTYYVPFVQNHPCFEHELINNNRSLSWFTTELNRRKTKTMLS